MRSYYCLFMMIGSETFSVAWKNLKSSLTYGILHLCAIECIYLFFMAEGRKNELIGLFVQTVRNAICLEN
jgi:hypothetical protein